MSSVSIFVSEWLLLNAKWTIFSTISWREQLKFWWDNDDDVRFVLDQHSEFDCYSVSLLKQQPVVRYVHPLGHIIRISIQPSNVLTAEATNTNSIFFGLTRSGLELTIYRHRWEHANHSTTDAVRIHIEVYSIVIYFTGYQGQSWLWSYGSWIWKFLCNQSYHQ
jgi:hypothetical protein